MAKYICPVVGLTFEQTSKHLFNSMMNMLSLPISLRVKACTKFKCCTISFHERFPKVTSKMWVTITHNRLGKTMQFYYVLKEHIYNGICISFTT